MTKEKEFIFPMNYKKKEKFLGFIEYKSLGVIAILSLLIFLVLKNIKLSLIISVSIFIAVVGFFSILILVGVNGENMIDFIYFIGKFSINEKVYVYRKTEEKRRVNICESLLKRGFK